MPATKERNPLFGLRARKVQPDPEAARAWLAQIGQAGGLVEGLGPGQRLFFWIGQAAKAVREDAGLKEEAVAVQLGRTKEMVVRFEQGKTRPQELEKALVAYAQLANVNDPRDIVAQAVRLWYEQGFNPADTLTGPDLPDPP